MRRPLLLPLALAATAIAVVPAGAAIAKGSRANQYEGRVVSVDRTARTFRLHDTERGTVRIRVTRATRFARLSGFSALRAGRQVEATVRRSNGRLIATKIETGGGHGGGGSDDS